MMRFEASDADAFRTRLLTSPGEHRDAEYKGSLPFGSRESFSLKLVRQIQGMSNAGGGYIVIGFLRGPTGLLEVDATHTDQTAATYEPTQISQVVNSYVCRGQSVKLDVWQQLHDGTGLRYPVIGVEGVRRGPLVCRSSATASDTQEAILEQGVVYLRRSGAETSKVTTPEDWEDVIGRAVEARRGEFLQEFRNLFDLMTGSAPRVPGADVQFEWTSAMRDRAFQRDPK